MTEHMDILSIRWRVGRSLGRTVYSQIGDEPSKSDPLLGLMETRELADYVVALHNSATQPLTDSLFVEGDIEAAQVVALDAEARLQRLLLEACDGPHKFVQHRDREEPWCNACRHTVSGKVVVPA
jgi:hypothetical protein